MTDVPQLRLKDIVRPEYVTTKEAAVIAGIATQTFVNQKHIGVNPPVPEPAYQLALGTSKLNFFRRDEIEQWSAARSCRPLTRKKVRA